MNFYKYFYFQARRISPELDNDNALYITTIHNIFIDVRDIDRT